MKRVSSISKLPSCPAVYALYGGKDRGVYVAYVGTSKSMKQRIGQHLVNRDSSVTTGTSAVGLNADYVTKIAWWEHSGFDDQDFLRAAELVAFDVLDPALRSRGQVTDRAKELHGSKDFHREMTAVFQAEPAGELSIPSLEEALNRIDELERRIAALEEGEG
ncbi:MAG: hypothetical protein ACXABY_26270 [Candidatus Thorarchaeota archaeon]|jgi:hypothetical protein